MDPAKRICLKNLPENCTKREIAEMVRNRTGAQPHSIDLGLDAEGNTRRYAHFSCEGAKNVLEVLAGGTVLRGQPVQALPARQHYSFLYAEARRKREREEEDEKKSLEEFWEEKHRHFLARTNGGELSLKKLPKSFYASRQKYALVASEIATRLRVEHAARRSGGGYAGAPARLNSGHYHERRHKVEEGEGEPWSPPAAGAGTSGQTGEDAEAAAAAATQARAPLAQGAPHHPAARFKEGVKSGRRPVKDMRRGKGKTAAPEVPAPAPPPAAPPQPTKEERKLSGLQAKLAALKEKMQKK